MEYEHDVKIPTDWVGPIKINGQYAHEEFQIPLATVEKALVPSVSRGCKATSAKGIDTIVEDYGWSRAPVLRASTAKRLLEIKEYVESHYDELKEAAESTTAYGKLTKIDPLLVGRVMYLRLNMLTGDAAGHNMTTKAASAVVSRILKEFSDIELIALSGNYCTDKKVSAVNSIAGRGKKVIAETVISKDDCKSILRSSPEKIAEVNAIKNHQGSIVAGSLCSANAHFANILAALYLATGQDIANIVEGSQGITTAEVVEQGLYFSVTLPNLIVGTIGGGTSLPTPSFNLEKMGCKGTGSPLGSHARKLAEIIAAAVLAGELNLLAVLTNKDELVHAHERIERRKG